MTPPTTSAVARRCLALCGVVAASAWIAFGVTVLGDYPGDAGPAVEALAHGHVAAFLGAHPDMGPVSILLRAPFTLLGGGDQLAAYRWGCFACLLAAGLLGLYLARLAGGRGAGLLARAGLAAVCLVNPLTFAALQAGHPEELVTAALAVAAVAVASQGRSATAAILLGLAVASKQWAVIAILPVLMALPARRIRVALAAAAIALALLLPGVLASPHAFLETQRSLAIDTQNVTPWSAWFPTAGLTTQTVAATHMTAHTYYASAVLARVAHPLIIAVAILLPLALAWRRGRFSLSGADAMALLALLALLRCVLDPVDNLYYHAPLLLALAGWDAVASRGLPLRALSGALALELLSRWGEPPFDLHQFNALYLSVAAATAIAIAFTLLRRPGRRLAAVPAVGVGFEQASAH